VVFQKKLNYIKATKFFLYDPLTTSFIRLWRAWPSLADLSAYGVITRFDKKHYPWNY
jgi:hypothetical protein